jgi:hypothetical protein
MWKKWTTWCVIFSLFVIGFNGLGLDDYNILLFVTNPLFWYLENHPEWRNFTRDWIHAIHLLFWLAFGLAVDLIRYWWKNRTKSL